VSWQRMLSSLLLVKTADEETRRRGRNTIILTCGLLITALVMMPVAVVMGQPQVSLGALGVCLLIFSAVIALARRGIVAAAALLLISVTLLVPLVASLVSGRVGAVPFFFLLGLLVAGLTLRPLMIIVAMLLNMAGIAVLWWAIGSRPQQPLTINELIIYGIALHGFVALLSALGARQTARALRLAHQARISAEQTAGALRETLTEQEAQAGALREALTLQQQLNATIAELSLPIIPLREDLLVMPLIGALDRRRLAAIEAALLEQVSLRRARVVLLDITGVPVVEAEVAEYLLRIAASVRLLGARPILVGIRAGAALTLAGLGTLELAGLESLGTVQQALERLSE
jgi:rsbT co-antagonist protein RsbR